MGDRCLLAAMNDNDIRNGSNRRTAIQLRLQASAPRHSVLLVLNLPSAAFCLGSFPMTGIYRWKSGQNMKDVRLTASSL